MCWEVAFCHASLRQLPASLGSQPASLSVGQETGLLPGFPEPNECVALVRLTQGTWVRLLYLLPSQEEAVWAPGHAFVTTLQ